MLEQSLSLTTSIVYVRQSLFLFTLLLFCYSANNTIFISQSAGRVSTVAHSPPTHSFSFFCGLISRPVRRLDSKPTQNASLQSFPYHLVPPFRGPRPRPRQTNPARPLRRCIPQHQPSRSVRHRLALQTARWSLRRHTMERHAHQQPTDHPFPRPSHPRRRLLPNLPRPRHPTNQRLRLQSHQVHRRRLSVHESGQRGHRSIRVWSGYIHLCHPGRGLPGELYTRVDMVQQNRRTGNVHELRTRDCYRFCSEASTRPEYSYAGAARRWHGFSTGYFPCQLWQRVLHRRERDRISNTGRESGKGCSKNWIRAFDAACG